MEDSNLNYVTEMYESSKNDEQELRKFHASMLKAIQPDIDKFNEFIVELNKKRENFFKKLFSAEFEELKNKNKIEFLIEVTPIYRYFIFFPSKEIIDRFRYLGFQREALKWFVDINLIKEQILKINSSNEVIIIPSDNTINLIHNHIFFNGLSHIFSSYNLYSEKRKEGMYTNLIYNKIYDISRRKEIAAQNITDSESLITSYFQSIFKFHEGLTGESKKAKKLSLGILQGNTKKFLRYVLIDNVFFFTRTKQYHHLYELCRLLFPVKNLWKSEEFDKNNNLKGSYYNLKQYQNKMVIKCLGNQKAFPKIASEEKLNHKLHEFRNSAFVTFWSKMNK